MIEVSTIGGVLTAIIRDELTQSDIEEMSDVEAIWVTPRVDAFELQRPLLLRKVTTLYVAKCQQRLIDILEPELLGGLRTLLVSASPRAFDDISQIRPVSGLHTLKVRLQDISEEAIRWICQHTTVVALALTDVNVSDAMVGSLACRGVLRRLDLFRTNVTFTERDMLGVVFPQTRSLDVSQNSVTSASVEIIRSVFPNLERLLARDTLLSKHDVSRIALWDRMKVLDTGTPEIDFDKHGDELWDL